MKQSRLHLLLLACGLASSLNAVAAGWLIQDVRVFDGERMQAPRHVLTDGGKIVDANFHGKLPAGAQVISGKGRTLLPGLIDAHVHAYQHLDLPLLFGVTTQIDMFTSVALMQDISKKMQRGENSAAADLFSAGTLATAPGGHGTEYGITIPTLTKPQEAQAFVDARIAEGSHFIKIVMEQGSPATPFNSLDLATVTALIQAAHLRGKLAVVHIDTLESARQALQAGADGLVHLFVGKTISQADARSFALLAKQHKAFVIPTFSVLESVAGVKPLDLLDDTQITRLLHKEQIATLKSSYSSIHKADLLTAPRASVAALQRAQVPILAGTDAGNAGTLYGASLHHEMAALVQAGLSPNAALAAATSAPAKAFRLSDRGRIAKGFKADLVLVEGDPSRDIAATKNIVEIWKDGTRVSAQRQQQAEKVAQAAQPKAKIARVPTDMRISLFGQDKLSSPIGFGWAPSTDSFMGGKSTATIEWQAAEPDGQAAVAISASIVKGFPFPWAGLAFMPGTQPMAAADLSFANVLKFKVKGDGQNYRVTMMMKDKMMPVDVAFETSDKWTEVVLPFEKFADIDPSMITLIGFNAGPKVGDYKFQIADVRLVYE